MIAELEGMISRRDDTSVVLMTGGGSFGGVGYKVRVTPETLDKLASIGGEGGSASGPQKVRLLTYLAVREDALDLYGFLDQDALELFELLISVNGIGPKTAINILSLASASTLRGAIATGEPAHLSKISGIGKKNAEKIVMELKDKFSDERFNSEEYRDESDAVEALKSLGYSERESREALKKIDKKTAASGSTSDKLKQALKLLGK